MVQSWGWRWEGNHQLRRILWWWPHREERWSEQAGARLASKRKREDELTQQAARHSLWEQGSLQAYSGWLFGFLDGEVRALKQRKAEYDD